MCGMSGKILASGSRWTLKAIASWRNKVKRPSGIALMVVIVNILILGLVVAALGTLSLSNLKATSSKSWERQARFAAYAGIQESLAQLDLEPTWAPTEPWTKAVGEGEELHFSVEVVNNVNSADGESILAPDNTWIPPGAAWVRSKGFLGEVGTYKADALIALVSRARPTFDHALFSRDQIRLEDGTAVDSYNALLAGAPVFSSQTNPSYKAHLGTQSSQLSAITISGGSWADGNAYVGTDSSGTGGTLDGITGTVAPLERDKNIFKFRPSAAVGALPLQVLEVPKRVGADYVFPWETSNGTGDQPRKAAYSTVNIQANHPDWGRATNLFSGEYYVDGDLILKKNPVFAGSGRVRINVHANDEFPVVIYVKGNVLLSQVEVVFIEPNPTGGTSLFAPRRAHPRQLQIYALGGDEPGDPQPTFTMVDSVMHGVVAGKSLKVHIKGGSELFGGVIAKDITVANSKIHYDSSLAGITLNGRSAWDILSMKSASVGESEQATGTVDLSDNPKPRSLADLAVDAVQGTRGGRADLALMTSGTIDAVPESVLLTGGGPLPPLGQTFCATCNQEVSPVNQCICQIPECAQCLNPITNHAPSCPSGAPVCPSCGANHEAPCPFMVDCNVCGTVHTPPMCTNGGGGGGGGGTGNGTANVSIDTTIFS